MRKVNYCIILFALILTGTVPATAQEKKEREEAVQKEKLARQIQEKMALHEVEQKKVLRDVTEEIRGLELKLMSLRDRSMETGSEDEALHLRAEMMELENKLRNLAMTRNRLHGGSEELSAEMEKEGLAFLREYLPERHKEIMELKKESNDEAYKIQVLRMVDMKRDFEARAGKDKDYFDILAGELALNQRTERLVMMHRSAEAQKKAIIRSDLEKTLGELFDIREKQREREMFKLQEKLETLEKNLKLRQQNKQVIVENRLKQLLGEAGSLDW